MIRSLRSLHRIALPVLGLASGGVFVGAVLARRSQPVVSTFPDSFYSAKHKTGAVLGTVIVIGTLEITTGIFAEDGKEFLLLSPRRDPGRPDVLVYWSETKPEKETLPANAVLLGSLIGITPRTFPLPSRASATPHFVTLYSPATREVIGTAEIDMSGNR